MFEQEVEAIRSTASRLKAEIHSTNLHHDHKNKASSKIDEAVSGIEDALVDRASNADANAKPGQPHLDGRAGTVGDEQAKSGDATKHAVSKINDMADAVAAA